MDTQEANISVFNQINEENVKPFCILFTW